MLNVTKVSSPLCTTAPHRFRAAHPKLYEYKTYCMRSAVARGFTHSAAGRRRLYTFRVSRAGMAAWLLPYCKCCGLVRFLVYQTMCSPTPPQPKGPWQHHKIFNK